MEPLALQADATNLDLEMHAYERPLAVTPGGTLEIVPNWQDTRAMHAITCASQLGKWIRTEVCVPFRAWVRIASRGNKWFVALLATSALSASLKI